MLTVSGEQTVAPDPKDTVPTAQGVQEAEESAAEKNPDAQSTGALLWMAQEEPMGHGVHTVLPVLPMLAV